MKRSRLKTFYFREKATQKDSEGNTYPVYGQASPFSGEAWPASGKIQAQIYGDKLPYIYNLRILGRYEIVHNNQESGDGQIHYLFPDLNMDLVEGDGICLFVDQDQEPDYRIISAKPYRFLKLEVERI